MTGLAPSTRYRPGPTSGHPANRALPRLPGSLRCPGRRGLLGTRSRESMVRAIGNGQCLPLHGLQGDLLGEQDITSHKLTLWREAPLRPLPALRIELVNV